MTIAEIKKEIPQLTFAEKAKIAQALDLKYDAWDLQMIEDCQPGGKLSGLFKEAEAEDKRGETEECP